MRKVYKHTWQYFSEEEYLDAVSVQDQKQNAEWYEFNDENINTLFH